MNSLIVATLPIQFILEVAVILDYHLNLVMIRRGKQEEREESIVLSMEKIGVTQQTINEWLKCNPEMEKVILWESGLYATVLEECKKVVCKMFYRNRPIANVLDEDEQHSIAADAVLHVFFEIKKPVNENQFDVRSLVEKAFIQGKRRAVDFAINEINKKKKLVPIEPNKDSPLSEVKDIEPEVVMEEKIKKSIEIYNEIYNELGNRKNDSRRVHLESIFRALSIQFKNIEEGKLKFVVLYFLRSPSYLRLPSGVKEDVIKTCCKNENTYHIHTKRLREYIENILRRKNITMEFFKK